ncbi:MAG: protein translocase subunit SecD [Streptosporangiales bacterium]|nr:protein translocase subunit SecD [Streptosporangiales bacterium]
MPPPTTNVSRPGRALAVLALIVVALGAAAWFGNARTPKLALDLSGGTTVTLTAVTQQNREPPDSSMEEAVQIIRDRVNGLGVSEAEVSRQGGNNIVVAVPGEGQQRVVEQVGQTAELNFRQVLLYEPAGMTPQPTSSPSPSPSEGSSDKQSKDDKQSKNRALSPALMAQPSPDPGNAPPGGVPVPGASQPAVPGVPPGMMQQDTSGIDKEVLAEFQKLDCSRPDRSRGLKEPNEQIAACNRDGTAKYVLDKAVVLGKMVDSAQAGLPQTGQAGGWLVQLNFDSTGTQRFGDITQRVVSMPEPRNQIAIELDSVVQSAPRINEPIPGGQAEITGDFTQQQASDLANVLKYGALPLKFNKSDITSVSPTLGADYLRGGLLAGAIGMALVVIYALLYYRALGFVAIFSLGVAGALTYAAVSVLGNYMGYRLSLAGIAGLIVAIGITVDSFIVYFERLRDEVREGRSLRAGVERGWRRARRTILVADAVTFLAALVLWLLAIGGVKGFAFTLGLTTLIDVLVVFLFTKPMVVYLSRTKFFGSGHALSGLDPRRMGLRAPSEVFTGRRRTTPREA